MENEKVEASTSSTLLTPPLPLKARRKIGKSYSTKHLKVLVKKGREESKIRFSRKKHNLNEKTKSHNFPYQPKQLVTPSVTPITTPASISSSPCAFSSSIIEPITELTTVHQAPLPSPVFLLSTPNAVSNNSATAVSLHLSAPSGIQIDNFSMHLSSWAVENNISNNSYSKLLKIIKNDLNLEIPQDARTLLKTNVDLKHSFIEMSDGKYYHFGLEDSLMFVLKTFPLIDVNADTLVLEINFDGLPLAKSSGSQFWPILADLENIPQDFVFAIGVFHGYKKPRDSDEFLHFLVDDFCKLKGKGVSFNGKIFKLKISKLLCDAPAKSFIMSVKGHNAYFGCTKCTTEGNFVKNRMTYPDIDANLRTDESVKNMTDEDYHKKEPTSLLKLEIGLVSQIPLDYMHLVCLGVVKKLIMFWVKGDRSVRLTNQDIDEIDRKIIKYRNNSVMEFVRKPRSLREVDRWKATEFRQFILYYGPFLLLPHLNRNMFLHFLCLHCAIRILASPYLCFKYNNFAHILLRHFVEHYGDFYGAEYICHNVHNLVHLSKDVLKFGNLDKFSCFKFENYMHIIKQSIKSLRYPLKQFVKKVFLNRKFSKKQCKLQNIQVTKPLGQTKINNQNVLTYGEVNFNNVTVRVSEPNCFIILKNGTPAKVTRIFVKNRIPHIEYKAFQSFKDSFSEPCSSKLFYCGYVGVLSDSFKTSPYAVAKDDKGGVSIVPLKWMKDDTSCFWPKSKTNLTAYIIKETTPRDDWTTSKLVKIYGKYALYREARDAEICFGKSTDDESDNQTVAQLPEKRKSKPRKFPDAFEIPTLPATDLKSINECEYEAESEASSSSPASSKSSEIMQDPSKTINNLAQVNNEIEDLIDLNLTSQNNVNVMNAVDASFTNEVNDPVVTINDLDPTIVERNENIMNKKNVIEKQQNVVVQNFAAIPEEEFKALCEAVNENNSMLQLILSKVNAITMDNPLSNRGLKDTKIKNIFPVNDLEELVKIDETLKSDEEMQLQLQNRLVLVGGGDSKSLIRGCLTFLITNNLGTLCSWTGQKNNFMIKDLTIISILKGAVKEVFPFTTDKDFATTVADWLRFSNQRKKREN